MNYLVTAVTHDSRDAESSQQFHDWGRNSPSGDVFHPQPEKFQVFPVKPFNFIIFPAKGFNDIVSHQGFL